MSTETSALFPTLRAIVERAREANTRANKAAFEKDAAVADLASAELEAAQEQACAAYAAELLPAVLGGEWKATGNALVLGAPGPLFDHALVLRPARCRGLCTWNTCVVVSEPYMVPGAVPPPRPVPTQVREHAHALIRAGVRVWLRHDLSAHFPGWTALVLASKRLPGDGAAERFGFTDLGAPASEGWGRPMAEKSVAAMLSREDTMKAISDGVERAFFKIMKTDRGRPTGDLIFEAIQEGVHDAFWHLATNATIAPCRDFYEHIRDGVTEAVSRMDLGKAVADERP